MTRLPAETIPPSLENLIPGYGTDTDTDTGFFDATIAGIPLVFVVFLVFLLAVVGGIVAVIIKNYRYAKSRGYDPLTMETEMAARLMESQLMQPGSPSETAPAASTGTVEERLAEIDGLHERGVISAEERAAARAKILGG